MATKTTDQPNVVPPAEDDAKHSLWASPWFAVSVALVAFLVIATVWLIVDDPDPVVSPAAPHPHAAPAATGCGPAGDDDQTPPVTAPATTWSLVGSMAAPTSTTAGPASTADGIGVCYSADPTGALFAAANFVAATSDPDLCKPVIEQLAADGPGRDTALDQIAASPCRPGDGVQLAGFTFLAYTARTSATVDLALTTQGEFVHAPLQLTWTGQDWRVQIPVTGRLIDRVAPIPSLAGYVPWQGA